MLVGTTSVKLRTQNDIHHTRHVRVSPMNRTHPCWPPNHNGSVSCRSWTNSPFSSGRQHLSYDVCLEVRGRLSELFCAEVMRSHKHTWKSGFYSSLDWVLSYCLICIYVYVFCVYFFILRTVCAV